MQKILNIRIYDLIGHWALVITIFIVILWKIFYVHHPVAPKIVTIHSRGLTYQVATRAETVEEVLREQGFDFFSVIPATEPGSRVWIPDQVRNDKSIFSGMIIELHPPLAVTLVDGGRETATTTDALTVNDFLLKKNIPLAATDRVTPPLDSYLGEGERVQIDRIVDTPETKVVDIPFKTELRQDPDQYYGRESLVVAGSPGKKEQKFLVTYKNGVEVRRKLLAEKVTEKPKTEVRTFGTRIEIVEEKEGRASWYATKGCIPAFAEATAGKCAAAPYYEIGRYVRVTSLQSGKSIIVRINDRGPDTTLHPDRVIDLDVVAYRELASPATGTIAVKVELLRN